MKKDKITIALMDMLQKQDAFNTQQYGTAEWGKKDIPWWTNTWLAASYVMLQDVDHPASASPQVRMESMISNVVDIWSAMLTHILSRRDEEESFQDVAMIMADAIVRYEGEVECLNLPEQISDLFVAFERFISDTIEFRESEIEYFIYILDSIGLDFETLYTWYLAKDKLNEFRVIRYIEDGAYDIHWRMDGGVASMADHAVLANVVNATLEANVALGDLETTLKDSLVKEWNKYKVSQ